MAEAAGCPRSHWLWRSCPLITGDLALFVFSVVVALLLQKVGDRVVVVCFPGERERFCEIWCDLWRCLIAWLCALFCVCLRVVSVCKVQCATGRSAILMFVDVDVDRVVLMTNGLALFFFFFTWPFWRAIAGGSILLCT